MPALLHGGGDLPRGMKMDLRSGIKSSLSQVASSVANNLNRSADIVDQRTAELWTFERRLSASDPNWTLSRVDAAEA